MVRENSRLVPALSGAGSFVAICASFNALLAASVLWDAAIFMLVSAACGLGALSFVKERSRVPNLIGVVFALILIAISIDGRTNARGVLALSTAVRAQLTTLSRNMTTEQRKVACSDKSLASIELSRSVDVFSPEHFPFRVSGTNGTCTFYSVGPDGQDDNGRAVSFAELRMFGRREILRACVPQILCYEVSKLLVSKLEMVPEGDIVVPVYQ